MIQLHGLGLCQPVGIGIGYMAIGKDMEGSEQGTLGEKRVMRGNNSTSLETRCWPIIGK